MENKSYRVLLALCIALRDSVLKKNPSPIDLSEKSDYEELFRLSNLHAVTACLSKAVCISQCDDEIKKKWAEAEGLALKKEILFDNELSKIEKIFHQEKIKYVLLKGIVLKSFYPQKGLRQFCDYDVLIEKEKANKAKAIMKDLGYSVSNDKKDEATVSDELAVIECKKKPVFNFELHKKLFFGESVSFFENVWERIYFDGENVKGKMSDEDFYIFHLAHLHSHISERSGAGIRYIADHYVLKNTLCKKPSFQRDYVENVLSGNATNGTDEEKEYFNSLSLFEKRLDECVNALFYAETPDVSALEDFLEYGVHGTVENKVNISLKKESRFAYGIKRIFPPYRLMCIRYRILEKIPFLLPFFWIFRAFEILFDKKRRKYAQSETKAIINNKK